jgi:hypothetical protein
VVTVVRGDRCVREVELRGAIGGGIQLTRHGSGQTQAAGAELKSSAAAAFCR